MIPFSVTPFQKSIASLTSSDPTQDIGTHHFFLFSASQIPPRDTGRGTCRTGLLSQGHLGMLVFEMSLALSHPISTSNLGC